MIERTLSKIKYKDWEFVHWFDEDMNAFLQIQFMDNDERQFCRIWFLDPTLTPAGIVKTAWAAVLAAEEHEARETFRYEGKRIFSPHLDVTKLVEFATKENLDEIREPK
jgi:hypothetical protein